MLNSSDKMKENRTGDMDGDSYSLYLNTSDPVFIINRKGEFTDVNNAFCQKIGRSEEEILGMHIGEASFLTEETRKKAMYRHVSRLIGRETPVYTLDVITKSGFVLSLEIDTKPYAKHGEVAGEIGIVKNAKKIIRERDRNEGAEKDKTIKKRVRKENSELLNAFEKIRTELMDSMSELKKGLQEINKLQAELEKKLEELESMNADLEIRNNLIGDIKKQLTDKQMSLREKTKVVDQLQIELEQRQQELETKNLEINKRDGDIKQLQKELEDRDRDLEFRNNELNKRDKEIKQIQTELQQKEEEIEARANEIGRLKTEKDQLSFYLQNINNSIPSPVIMINKDDIVTHWSKKAEGMLDLDAEKAIGKNLFEIIELVEKERVRNGLIQCQKNKKPASIKSISVKNKRGDVYLTDISHMPILNSQGESQGAVVIINDVSEIAEMQAELKRKQEDLEDLNCKFQEAYKKLSLVDREIEVTNEELRRNKLELEEKNNEIDRIKTELVKRKEELESRNIELELIRQQFEKKGNENVGLQKELTVNREEPEVEEKNGGMLGETWENRPKTYEEIDRYIDTMDEHHLKSKNKKVEDKD